MPVNLDPRCLARLTEEIKSVFLDGEVAAGDLFPSAPTWYSMYRVAKVLPSNIEQLGLAGNIPDDLLPSLIFDAIENASRDYVGERKQAKPIPLKSVIPDAASAAHEVVQRFTSLPWCYTAIFETPFLKDHLTTALPIKIGDGILAEIAVDSANYPLLKGSDWILQHVRQIRYPEEWPEKRLYLSLTLTGYVTRSRSSDPLLEAFKNYVKAFFGFCRAMGVCKVERFPFSSTLASPIFLYLERDGSREPLEYRAFSREESETLGEIRVADKTASEVHRLLSAINEAFELSQQGLLMNAARWYFDSLCGTNDLLNFVQATTALEILLGGSKQDAEQLGITKLLANRCAYLVGRSATERAQILREFTEIYDTRSKIVHSGKWLLNSKEQNHLATLRELCRKSLIREFLLLKQNAEV